MARPGFWIDTFFNKDVGTAATTIDSLMTNVSATQSRRGWTMVRTIIGIDFAYTVHDSGEGSQVIAMGIGVASQEAFAASAISDPQTSMDHPTSGWVFRTAFRVFGFAADQPTIFVRRIEKDIRAKRKIQNGEMFFTVDNDPLEGVAAAIRMVGYIRQYWLDE